MTSFIDGPAKGETLMLHRSPRFLRVTEKGGKFDALDQLEDVPEPGETLHAYEACEVGGMCHIRMSGKAKAGSGFYRMMKYQLVEPQPAPQTMQTLEAWRAWCLSQPKSKLTGP